MKSLFVICLAAAAFAAVPTGHWVPMEGAVTVAKNTTLTLTTTIALNKTTIERPDALTVTDLATGAPIAGYGGGIINGLSVEWKQPNGPFLLSDCTWYVANAAAPVENEDTPVYHFNTTFRTLATAHPTILSVVGAPANNSIAAALDLTVVVDFDQAMDETFTTAEFINHGSGDVAPVTKMWAVGGKRVTVTIAGALSYYTMYTLNVVGRNADGMPVLVGYSSYFRTLANMVPAIAPMNGTSGVSAFPKIEVSFAPVAIETSTLHVVLAHLVNKNESHPHWVWEPLPFNNNTVNEGNVSFIYEAEAALATHTQYAVTILQGVKAEHEPTTLTHDVVIYFNTAPIPETPAPAPAGGLSSGAIAGIVIGVIGGILIIGGVIYYCKNRKTGKGAYNEL